MCILVCLVLATPLALWLTFQRKPHWYRPVETDPATIRKTSNDALNWADHVSDRMVRGVPFELLVADEEVTHFAAAAPAMFPDEFASWPPEIRDPAISFDDGMVKVGFFCEYDGWRVIGVGHIDVSLIDEDTLFVRLDGVRGGLLPIPRRWIRKVFDPLLARWQQNVDDVPDWIVDLKSVDQLYEGFRIPNRFLWPNGKRRFRLAGLESRGGTMKLSIEPY